MRPSSFLLLAVTLSAVAIAPAQGTVKDTRHHCYMDGAWGDVCRYENLCFGSDSTHLIFINDDPGSHFQVKGSQPIWAATKLYREIGDHPNPSRDVPMHYKKGPIRVVSSEWIEEHSDEVEWSDHSLWIPSYHENLGNIWYYSSRILPLFTAWTYREQYKLPKMDHVVIVGPEQKLHHSWHEGLLNLTISRNTKVFYASDPPYYGLLNKETNIIKCFKNVVLLGSNMFGFPDMITADKFRRRAYKNFGLPIPVRNEPPKKVTILDRAWMHSRHFVNIVQMKEIMEKYGEDLEIERVILNDASTFEEQVKLFANTGVLVTMHGAGLMNEIFMPPGAAVIEVFPVHLKQVLYERVAHYAGIYHFKVYARTFQEGFHEKHPEYLERECDTFTSLSMPDNGYCWLLIKNSNVVTPLPEFEVAFAHALDHIGYRTKLKPTLEEHRDWSGDTSIPEED